MTARTISSAHSHPDAAHRASPRLWRTGLLAVLAWSALYALMALVLDQVIVGAAAG